MFHRLTKIIFAAGVTVAVIVATGGPASARASASGPGGLAGYSAGRALSGDLHAVAARDAAAASAPVPVDVRGFIAWTLDDKPIAGPGETYTGGHNDTEIFRINMLDVNGSGGQDYSTASMTDNLNFSDTDNDTHCKTAYKGSYSGSAPFVDFPTPEFEVSSAGAKVTMTIAYEENYTWTDTRVTRKVVSACHRAGGRLTGLAFEGDRVAARA